MRTFLAALPAAALAAVVLAFPGNLPAQGLTPAQKKQVEAMIEDIDQTLNGGSEKNNTRALTACQAALKSPKATYEFFMDSTKELDFDQAGKRETDWREWRERNEDRYKSSEHVAALQYQLRFLVLTLNVRMAKDRQAAMKKALPELVAYYDQVAENFEKLDEHQRVLSADVLDSIFAKRLKLDVTIPRGQEWILSPLPVSRAYDELILPYYRKAKDHRALQSAWDKRIAQEGQTLAAESAGGSLLPGRGAGRRWNRDPREAEREEKREENRTKQESLEKFKTERLPELQWGKERDALLFGPDQAAAFANLGRLVRDNLAHRDAVNWLNELKSLAEGNWNAASYYEGGGE